MAAFVYGAGRYSLLTHRTGTYRSASSTCQRRELAGVLGRRRRRPEVVLTAAAQPSGSAKSAEKVHEVESEATRLIGVLADFWSCVCDMISGETEAPIVRLSAKHCASLREDWVLDRLNEYLRSCRDICSEFGDTIQLQVVAGAEAPVFVLSKAQGNKLLFSEDEDDWDDWDDWDNIDMSILDKYSAQEDRGGEEIVEPVPKEDDVILKKTFEWVQAVVVDLGICPFTSSTAARAGVPIGDVRYTVTRDQTVEEIYREYWSELRLILETDQTELSTTLLITPEFCMDNPEAFDAFTETLTMPLATLGVEKEAQLVFFHPQYLFRDGASRIDAGESAANYARRSPWPMINILRTNQVRAAQRVIPTGLVYKQNEEVLKKIGPPSLESMLRQRKWDDLKEQAPVDRRSSNPVFDAARKLREMTGETF